MEKEKDRSTSVRQSVFDLQSFDSACKPGSVEGNHLSLCYVAITLRNESLHVRAANTADAFLHHTGVNRIGVASDRVYSRRMLPCEWVSSYLAFPSSPRKCVKHSVRLSISVALSRVSPPADVIRYPFPGSPDFPHDKTFRLDIARLPGKVKMPVNFQTIKFTRFEKRLRAFERLDFNAIIRFPDMR